MNKKPAPYKIKSRKTLPKSTDHVGPVGPRRRDWDELFHQAIMKAGEWLYFDTPFRTAASAKTTCHTMRKQLSENYDVESRGNQVFVRYV